MAGSVERIERDLAALEGAIAKIAKEFYSAYSSYFTVLGQAVKQQLILASYHVCTQGYPDRFLSLSFSQRQQLQQSLKQIAFQVQADLLAQLHFPAKSAVHATSDNSNSEIGELTLPVVPDAPITDPKELIDWQKRLEEAVAKILQGVSRSSNRLLQQEGILSKKLPEPVLEAAAKVEATADSAAGVPNLLNLAIEIESDREPQIPTMTHIIAIHLRLSEIEFADPTVIAARHQIRNLSAQLNNLEREYHKKQRERAVAEAQSAWRSSWYDE